MDSVQKAAEQVVTSHPNLESVVGSDSPDPANGPSESDKVSESGGVCGDLETVTIPVEIDQRIIASGNALGSVLSKVIESAESLASGGIRLTDSAMAMLRRIAEPGARPGGLGKDAARTSADMTRAIMSLREALIRISDHCDEGTACSVRGPSPESSLEEVNLTARSVSEVVGLIASIALQTNLLALNTAVEAARSGDEGRGYAEMAAQVRGLAEETSRCAMTVAELASGVRERCGNISVVHKHHKLLVETDHDSFTVSSSASHFSERQEDSGEVTDLGWMVDRILGEAKRLLGLSEETRRAAATAAGMAESTIGRAEPRFGWSRIEPGEASTEI